MGKMNIVKLKAATLVETIIAMLIILIVTGITVMILVQVTSTGYSIQNLKATSLIDRVISETDFRKSFFNEEIFDNGFKVRKEIIDGDFGNAIVSLRISVYDLNNKLIKYKNCLLLSK